MRGYFRRYAEGYENGILSRLAAPVLGVAGWAYGSAVNTTRALYEKNILKSSKLGFPVVSVGNLTWGGTGKTPFVEYLARKISEQGRTPLILTRGYSKDEVEQFRQHLPKTIIGVGKKRAEVAAAMSREHKIDIGLLDDGFQHWPVQRDLEIVMINALNPFGNGKLIPQGILREPVPMLKRAAIVVISHTNLVSQKDLEALKEHIHKLAPNAEIVESFLEPLFFYRAKKRARVSLNRLEHQKVTTFSGVAAPRSFQILLSRLHIKPIRNFEFVDHHLFSEKELREIKEVSDSAAVSEIITTEKDFYRCPDLIGDVLNPLILATRLHISSGEELLISRVNRLFGAAQG